MALSYAVNKIANISDKVIICNCDAFSGLLIHYVLEQLIGRDRYQLVHHFEQELIDEWKLDLTCISDTTVIKEWEQRNKTRVLTTCWSYERTLKALKDSGIQTPVRVYKFCDIDYPPTPF